MSETAIAAERAGAELQEQFDDMEQQKDAASLGMWAFLATEVLFFGGLFAAYTITRFRYPEGFAAASGHTDVLWGAVESAVLLTSSFTMTLAVRAVRLGQRRHVTRLLAVTLLLGTVFFAIHMYEYHNDYLQGLIPGVNFTFEQANVAHQAELFFFLYYAMTLLHLTHLTFGILVLGVIALMNARGRFTPDYYTPVEVSGLYWHFVDIVWLFLYPLLYLVSRA
jgi:cytochrome c oxidase subunit 3